MARGKPFWPATSVATRTSRASISAIRVATTFPNFRAAIPPAILEIGCGDGATGALALAERKCGRYVGVELFEEVARRAEDRLSHILIGNVETMDLPLARPRSTP